MDPCSLSCCCLLNLLCAAGVTRGASVLPVCRQHLVITANPDKLRLQIWSICYNKSNLLGALCHFEMMQFDVLVSSHLTCCHLPRFGRGWRAVCVPALHAAELCCRRCCRIKRYPGERQGVQGELVTDWVAMVFFQPWSFSPTHPLLTLCVGAVCP